MKHKSAAVLLIIITIVACIGLHLFYRYRYVQIRTITKEHFEQQQHPDTLTDPAETYKRDHFGIQKCDVLLSRSPELGDREYDIMSSVINGYRLNQWKPDPNDPQYNQQRADRVYCYMYNDNSNNIQDFNLHAHNGQCSKANPLFASSTAITNVFTNSSIDQTHVMPINKCVLEIDPASTSSDELNLLWRSWSTSHCDNISASLRQELVDSQDKLKQIKQNFNVLSEADSNMYYNRQTVDNSLSACGQCNISWSNAYWNQYGSLLHTQQDLTQTQRTSSFIHTSNQGLINDNTRLLDDTRKYDGYYKEVNINNTSCQSNLKVCHGERDFAEFRYNEAYGINQDLTAINAELTQDYNLLQSYTDHVQNGIVGCDRERQRITGQRDEKLRDLTLLKSNNDKCTIDRTTNSNNYTNENARLVDITAKGNQCKTERTVVENEYNTLMNNLSQCQATQGRLSYQLVVVDKNIAIETKVKERAEEDLIQMKKNYYNCQVATSKNDSTIKGLRQTNTQLYNELERNKIINQQMADTAMKDLNEAISCATREALDSVLKGADAQSKNTCSIRSDKYEELAQAEKDYALRELDKTAVANNCSSCAATLEQCIASHKKNEQLCNNAPGWKMDIYQDVKYKGKSATFYSTDANNGDGNVLKKGTDYDVIKGWNFGPSAYKFEQWNGKFEVEWVGGGYPDGKDIIHRGVGNEALGDSDVSFFRVLKVG